MLCATCSRPTAHAVRGSGCDEHAALELSTPSRSARAQNGRRDRRPARRKRRRRQGNRPDELERVVFIDTVHLLLRRRPRDRHQRRWSEPVRRPSNRSRPPQARAAAGLDRLGSSSTSATIAARARPSQVFRIFRQRISAVTELRDHPVLGDRDDGPGAGAAGCCRWPSFSRPLKPLSRTFPHTPPRAAATAADRMMLEGKIRPTTPPAMAPRFADFFPLHWSVVELQPRRPRYGRSRLRHEVDLHPAAPP